MSLNFHIKFERKDLWLLAAIMVFIIGVGYVIAYGSGNPQIHGHDIGEIEGGVGGGCSLGNWVDMTSAASGGAVQGPATSDGFVVARMYAMGSTMTGYSDWVNATTIRARSSPGDNQWETITFPVRKGDYWKVVSDQGAPAVYEVLWIPLNCGGGSSGTDYLKYSYTLNNGVAPVKPAVNSWTKIPLNIEDSDSANLGSLTSNQITLAAGTYKGTAKATESRARLAKLRLYDTTQGTTLLNGLSIATYQGSEEAGLMTLEGRFTLTSAHVLELQYYFHDQDGGITYFTQGSRFPEPTGSDGEKEVFSIIELEKIN